MDPNTDNKKLILNNFCYFILTLGIILSFSFRTVANVQLNYQTDTVIPNDAVFTYPTPDELLEVSEKEDISFYDKYLNPIDNYSKYIDAKRDTIPSKKVRLCKFFLNIFS